MKTYGRTEVQCHTFLTSALNGMSSQLHPGALPPVKELPVPIRLEAGLAPRKR